MGGLPPPPTRAQARGHAPAWASPRQGQPVTRVPGLDKLALDTRPPVSASSTAKELTVSLTCVAVKQSRREVGALGAALYETTSECGYPRYPLLIINRCHHHKLTPVLTAITELPVPVRDRGGTPVCWTVGSRTDAASLQVPVRARSVADAPTDPRSRSLPRVPPRLKRWAQTGCQR